MKVAINTKEHLHHPPRGAAGCPVCSRHDHTDHRIIGLIGGVEIKAWEITCPRCGSTEVVVGRLTELGKKILADAIAATNQGAPDGTPEHDPDHDGRVPRGVHEEPPPAGDPGAG
jgi:hypothetical protein